MNEDVNLIEYYSFLKKKWLVFVLTFFISVAGGFIYYWLKTPEFQADITIAPVEENSSLSGAGSMFGLSLGKGGVNLDRWAFTITTWDYQQRAIRVIGLDSFSTVLPEEFVCQEKKEVCEFIFWNKYIRKRLSANADLTTNTLQVAFTFYSYPLAKAYIENLVDQLETFYQKNEEEEIKNEILRLTRKISQEGDMDVRNTLLDAVALEKQKLMVTMKKRIKVISHPKDPSVAIFPSSPVRMKVILISIACGIFIVMLEMAFFILKSVLRKKELE